MIFQVSWLRTSHDELRQIKKQMYGRMQFRTIVQIEPPTFTIAPFEHIFLVGSCFADNIGKRFIEEKFNAIVNPYGVMYNPASILHTVERAKVKPQVAVFTLGTNHVYVFKETGEIVDNCQKRPQRLFREEELSIDACAEYLSKAIECLQKRNPAVHIILTVSPIRYAKYGYHDSQLSKATLLLASNQLTQRYPDTVTYFPAYEIVNDELRDYRFYQEDMLHPSYQAVSYIWERFSETYLSDEAKKFIEDWRPVKAALAHRPFDANSIAYQDFVRQTHERILALEKKWGVPLR